MPPEILNPILIVGLTGLLLGVALSLAAKVFYIEVDPRIEQVEDLLPGANCGGCAFPGCSGYAEAVVAGKAAPNLCVVDRNCGPEIAELLGLAVEDKVRSVAVVSCRGDMSVDNKKYDYLGDISCAEAVILAEGPNPCRYGCMAMGSCVKACKFDAIHLRDKEPPLVDRDKCVGCGACVSACPKSLITLAPENRRAIVLCCNHDKGLSAKNQCKIACIACGKCAKSCPEQAIEMANNLPVINYEKCVACGMCSAVCPQNTILFIGHNPAIEILEKEKAAKAAAKAEKEEKS
jgi:RnfABCDGE-type electron transport complex B subunit